MECQRDLESKQFSLMKNNLIELFSTENFIYHTVFFLYSSLSDSFLVFCQLRSSCRLLHLSFNELVVNQGFEIRGVTVTVFNRFEHVQNK